MLLAWRVASVTSVAWNALEAQSYIVSAESHQVMLATYYFFWFSPDTGATNIADGISTYIPLKKKFLFCFQFSEVCSSGNYWQISGTILV